jgi:hypothetical protein
VAGAVERPGDELATPDNADRCGTVAFGINRDTFRTRDVASLALLGAGVVPKRLRRATSSDPPRWPVLPGGRPVALSEAGALIFVAVCVLALVAVVLVLLSKM